MSAHEAIENMASAIIDGCADDAAKVTLGYMPRQLVGLAGLLAAAVDTHGGSEHEPVVSDAGTGGTWVEADIFEIKLCPDGWQLYGLTTQPVCTTGAFDEAWAGALRLVDQ